MKSNSHMALAISIVIIVMLIITCADSTMRVDRSMYGMWSADTSFKKKAGLDAFYIFVNPPKGSTDSAISIVGTICPVYILLKSDGKTKYNGVVKTTIRRTSIMPNRVATYKLRFDKKIDILPISISIKMDPINNMLILHSGKQMYGRMFKKPEPSFYCRVNSDTSLNTNKASYSTGDDDSSDSDDDEN